MSGSKRGRLAAASYAGLSLSVLSALVIPAVAAAADHDDPPSGPATVLLPAGPPVFTAVLPAPEPLPAPAPPPAAAGPAARPSPRVVALSSGEAVTYTPPREGEPPDSDFDRLAQCESGQRWDINTGNGYYGGLQFSASTWRSLGGPDLPHQHSREEQIEIGRRQWRQSGWQAWPSCSRQLGWRS
jgi:hypothetical protein